MKDQVICEEKIRVAASPLIRELLLLIGRNRSSIPPFCCFIEMRTTAKAPTHPAKTTFVLLELCFLLGQKYNCCYFIHISNFICDFFQIKIILVTRLLDEAHLKYVASSSVRVLHLKYIHTIILIWQ